MERTADETNGKNYKWVALALLWVAFFLQQGTRQIYSGTNSFIRDGLGLSNEQIGLIGTVFMFVYGICVPFAGLAADLFRRKWMVAIGVLVFCGGIFCSGFAASFLSLLVFYSILNGLGQTFYYPSATSLIGQLHKESRATALSLLQLGLYLGIIGCTWASGWMGELGADGWRTPFKLFGGIGIVWALALVFLLKDTKPVAAPDATGKPGIGETVGAIVKKPSAILLAIGLGMFIYVDGGFKTWMPDYLRSEAFAADFRWLDVHVPWLRGAPALFAVLWHYLGAIVGVMVGSRISDRFAKVRPGIRMEVNIAGLVLGIPFILLMARAQSLAACCVGMCLFGVFRGVYDSNLLASLFDVIKPRFHATAAGVMLCCGFVFGSSSSAVLGWMKGHFGLQAGFQSLALFYLVGALVILVARTCFLKKDYEG